MASPTQKTFFPPLDFTSGSDLSRLQKSNSESPGHMRRRSYKPLAVRKTRKRAVFKNGNCNVTLRKTSKYRLKYLQDFFNTLVDCQWRWTVSVFMVTFFGSWLLFAYIWLLISFTHGDLEPDHLPKNQAKNNWTPCVTSIDGFTSAFLYSIETQHTTGYGMKYVTNECPEAIFLMCLQSIVGLIIQAFMVGIVFAKMTRPKLRTQTLQFSKNAVICQRDGHLCLMFRLGDMRKSFIIGANITAYLIHTKHTSEGENLDNFQTQIDVQADGCYGDLFFIWPLVIVHKIDESSPLYYLSANDLLHQEKFEIVVTLEGTIENTGQSTQARSSYISTEIKWGYKFDDVVVYDKENQTYVVDNTKFGSVYPVETPLCSAAELSEYMAQNHMLALRSVSRLMSSANSHHILLPPPINEDRGQLNNLNGVAKAAL